MLLVHCAVAVYNTVQFPLVKIRPNIISLTKQIDPRAKMQTLDLQHSNENKTS